MNNKNAFVSMVKGLALFGAGFGIGYFASNCVLGKKIDDIVNDELNESHEYYSDIINELQDKLDNLVLPEDENKEKEVAPIEKEDKEENKEEDRGDVKEEKKVDYDKIIDNLNYNRYSTDDKGAAKAKPYYISEEEYGDYSDGYEKRMISFFPDDEVFMDSESEEVIDAVRKTFGNDIVSVMEAGKNVLIRNEKLKTDYKIFVEHGSYDNFLEEDEWEE